MEDTTSLFNYRDPRSLMADRYASQYMAPSGSLENMIVQTGANAGSLVGNALFGGRTSEMAEQMVLNEAIKESEAAEDPDERLSLFARALRKRGLEGYAQKVDSQLQSRLKTKADAQSAQQRQMSLTKLVMDKTGLAPDQAAAIAQDEAAVRELMKVETQVVEANGRQVLINKNTGQPIRDLGAAPDRRPLTKVTVNGREEESEFAKQLGKVQAARLGAAYDKRDAALRELKTFEELATLPDNQLISGSLAEPRVEIANFLNTVGLASEADAQKVASSQQFQKLSNDLVLARVKQLGYNPSDADRKFIEQTIPRLSSSAAARKQLMSFMARVARDVSEEVTAMETYAADKKTLTGYQPKIPQVSMGAPTKSVSSMTDEELLKALQNSKK